MNSVTNFANQWPQQDDNFVFLFDRVDIINVSKVAGTQWLALSIISNVDGVFLRHV